MLVCHIINPPLIQITNQCWPHHHLLPNTNPNPNVSFSLFCTNPLRSRHLRCCHDLVRPLLHTLESSRHRALVGTPSPRMHQWTATSPSSPRVPQPPSHCDYTHRDNNHHLLQRVKQPPPPAPCRLMSCRKNHHCYDTSETCSSQCELRCVVLAPPSKPWKSPRVRHGSHHEFTPAQ
ncbi:hypothetical protein DEO72_LG2g2813 [Vigna unguiculata]|uniref:Uncharacterized protein n=1 Tax=Vigna unguiculata TaxID=3917 RepID=A0A4D6L1Y7_VIGUN|nr:hypothetical protein DEO72_LG2g2813 [Vigna unguiculata]